MSRIGAKSKILMAVLLAIAITAGFSGWRLATAEKTLTGSATRKLLTWFWQANYSVFPIEDRAALAKLHRTAPRDSREQCVACHEDKRSSTLVLHRIHLRSQLLERLVCHDCHQEVDLAERDNESVVTWVDVGFCKKCHSAFPSRCEGPRVRADDYKTSCLSCHKGDDAPKHRQPYLSNTMDPKDCYGCHGGRVLPSTARHAEADWLDVHGAQALKLGADSCYRCHDFGLKFCDKCHDKKPPSHLPAERWKATHPQAARSDTRVCYSCHKTSDCRRCHLDHESGWMERHAAFVEEKGDSTCGECHSESSCGYCHMLQDELETGLSSAATSTP